MSDHWRRDQPQFFNAYELPWGKVDDVKAAHGVDARLVTRDKDTGQSTLMLKLPAGWKHVEDGADACLELFVLEGDVTGNGKRVRAGGYLAVPPQGGQLELSSEGGAQVLAFWDPLMPRGYYYDDQPFVAKVREMEWTMTEMPELRHGIMHKSLRWPDPAEGLMHGGPGGMLRFILMTPGFGESRQETHHDCWEEVIWLAGDFLMPERGLHSAGSVLNNPAELKHGGLMTQKGTVMLLHCNSPMGAEFNEIENGKEIVEHYHDCTSWLVEPKHTPWSETPQFPLYPNSEPAYHAAKR
ncbi:MAG: hypothetical protein R3C15_02135 [Thermoleophilia bacterium]